MDVAVALSADSLLRSLEYVVLPDIRIATVADVDDVWTYLYLLFLVLGHVSASFKSNIGGHLILHQLCDVLLVSRSLVRHFDPPFL